MHKLIEYLCDELKGLEKKVAGGQNLSVQELQYGDTLAHFRKNLIKADIMMNGVDDEEYSNGMTRYGNRGGTRYYRGGSYSRRGNGGYGRYSMGGNVEDMTEELRELMEDAPDEQTRKEFQKFINKLEQM